MKYRIRGIVRGTFYAKHLRTFSDKEKAELYVRMGYSLSKKNEYVIEAVDAPETHPEKLSEAPPSQD